MLLCRLFSRSGCEILSTQSSRKCQRPQSRFTKNWLFISRFPKHSAIDWFVTKLWSLLAMKIEITIMFILRKEFCCAWDGLRWYIVDWVVMGSDRGSNMCKHSIIYSLAIKRLEWPNRIEYSFDFICQAWHTFKCWIKVFFFIENYKFHSACQKCPQTRQFLHIQQLVRIKITTDVNFNAIISV